MRIIVVDDHAIVREGLRALLRAEPGLRVVGEAADGEKALAVAAKADPDLALVDIGMPGMGGVETARRLRRAHPGIRVIMVSINDDLGHVVDSFDAGACGYVVKDNVCEELSQAIEAARAGRRYCSPALRAALASRAPR